uniref:Deadringer n=1 Tax=Paracentrotus lividus TaxID=7656 RepID=E9L085_PARLI|nr:deadringer [Paracentrotus lividus]
MESLVTASTKHLSPRHLAMYEMSRREILEKYIHQNGQDEAEYHERVRRMSVDTASDHDEERIKEERGAMENEEMERRRVMEEQRRIIEEQRRIVEEQRQRMVEEQRRQLMEEEDEERRLLLEEQRRRMMRPDHDEEEEEEEHRDDDDGGHSGEEEMREDELSGRRDTSHAHIDLNMMRANSHFKEMIDKNRRFVSARPEDTISHSPPLTNGSVHDNDHDPYLSHRAGHGGSPDLPHSYMKAAHPLIKKEDAKTEMDVGLKDDLKIGGGLDDRDGEKPQTEWSFEEQFEQLYELSSESKRKEFLDDLFSFMQKRGTPVNRIPIMAKQVLDLYELYNLVVAKGGLVEVINKKQWREITKGLNLPASITSAAFTLRTQYMKYLYPYECEKKSLSSPSELQSAIDGNRREGRRPSYHSPHMHPRGPTLAYHHGLDLHTPSGSPPPTMIPHPSRIPTLPTRLSPSTSPIEDDHPAPLTLPRQGALSHAAMLAELAERGSIPPPAKRSLLAEEHHQRLLQLQQQHLLMPTAHMKVSSVRAHPENGMPLFEMRGDNSLVMSIELNNVLYQGVLYPRGVPGHPLIGIPVPRSSASPK